jgi:hypothetical protein
VDIFVVSFNSLSKVCKYGGAKSFSCMVRWWVLVLSGPEKPADFCAGLQNISWN